MEALDVLAWPVGRLGEAMAGLARFQGWQLRSPEAPVCPAELAYDRPEALHGWLEAAAAWLGVEAELVEVPYTEVASLVSGAGPALLCLPGREKPSFLALLGRQRRRVLLLGPDLAVHRVPVEVLCRPAVTPLRHRWWRRWSTSSTRSVCPGGTATGPVARCWASGSVAYVLGRAGSCACRPRPRSGSSYDRPISHSHLGGLLGAYATQYLCGILAWWLLGWGALHGRLDPAWLLAWGLLCVTVIPLRLWSTWSQGRLAFGVGGLLKTRLLAGALRLAPEEMRQQGAGQFLGRVLEAEAVEGLALSGGLLGLLAGVEVVMAACVLGTRGWGLAPCGAAGGLAGGGRRPGLARVVPAERLDHRPPHHDPRAGGTPGGTPHPAGPGVS